MGSRQECDSEWPGLPRAHVHSRDLVTIQEVLGHARIETTRICPEAPVGALRAAVIAAV